MRNNGETFTLIWWPVLVLAFFICPTHAMDDHEEQRVNALEYNLYDILGLTADSATPAQIKKAYRSLAAVYHPDKNPSPSASDRIRELNQAYEVLGDPDKRQRYDTLVRLGTATQPQLADKTLKANKLAQASLEIALSSGDTEKLQSMLTEFKTTKKPLPDTILETVVTILTTAPDKASILAKIELLFAHDPSLYSRRLNHLQQSLLHYFAAQGISDGVKLYLKNKKYSAEAFNMRNEAGAIPLNTAISSFAIAVQENWYKNTPKVISKEKASAYCTIIKDLAVDMHSNPRHVLTEITSLQRVYPYIGYLLDNAQIVLTQLEHIQYPFLKKITPSDSKISYEPLLDFTHNGKHITLHTIYHVKEFIEEYGLTCPVLPPNKTSSVKLWVALLQSQDKRIKDIALPHLSTTDPMELIETAIKTHNSTLLSHRPFDISGKENQILALFFQSASYATADIKEQTIILQTLLNHPTFNNPQAMVHAMPLAHFIYDLKKKNPVVPAQWVELIYACPKIDINIRHKGLTPLLHHAILMEKKDDKLYKNLFKRDDLNVRLSCNKKTVFWYAICYAQYDLARSCLEHRSFDMSLWHRAPEHHVELIKYIKLHSGYNEQLASFAQAFDRMYREHRQTHAKKESQQPTLPSSSSLPAIEPASIKKGRTGESVLPKLYAPHPLYLFGGLTTIVLLSAALHKYWLKPKNQATDSQDDQTQLSDLDHNNEISPETTPST